MWTHEQYLNYQAALKKSEAQWAEADKEFLARHPVPAIKIDGKSLDDWEPKINDPHNILNK